MMMMMRKARLLHLITVAMAFQHTEKTRSSSPEEKNARAISAIRQQAMKHEVGRGGTAQNEKEAARLYRLAGNRGDPKSLVKLGLMYLEGRGIQRNDTSAAGLFQKAAKLEDPEALFLSATMAHKGQGRPKNDAAAASLLHRAAERGDPAVTTTTWNNETVRRKAKGNKFAFSTARFETTSSG